MALSAILSVGIQERRTDALNQFKGHQRVRYVEKVVAVRQLLVCQIDSAPKIDVDESCGRKVVSSKFVVLAARRPFSCRDCLAVKHSFPNRRFRKSAVQYFELSSKEVLQRTR